MALFLINPGGGKKMARTKKRRTAAQRRATAKMIAANRARKGGKRRRKTTRRKSAPRVAVLHSSGGRMAKRARKRRSAPRRRRRVTRARVRRNPPRRRGARRRFQRNPPIVRILRDGAIQGLAGLAGSVAVRYIGKMVPVQTNPFVSSAIDLALGVGVVFAGSQLKLGPNIAAAVATGAMMRVYDSVLKRHLPPEVTAPLLGEDRYYGLTNGIPGGYGTGLYPNRGVLPGSGVDMGLYPGGGGAESEDYTL